MDINKRLEDKEKKELLAQLPEQWGLVLQVNKDCPFSIGFGRIVKNFAEKYNFQIYALSDVEEEFWGIKTILDNGIVSTSNPQREVPALFLLSSDGVENFPIARNLITEDQIITNIWNIHKNMGNLL